MSQVTRRELFPGVWLRAVHTSKFKSSYLSATLLAPLDRRTAGANALIPEVLRRGTAVHPDMESLSAALDELYGGAVEPAVRKRGETQCVGFAASFLDDAYALKGEKILEPAAGLLGELLLKPYTQGGHFCPDYTAGEKANLIDRIRAQINDKRTYAVQRLAQEMCRYEAFGVDKLGDEEGVAAITPESLWERYQALLREAQVEVYYCGSAHPDRVAEALKSALAALPVNEGRVDPVCDVRVSAGPEPIVVEESMDVSQGKLALGFRTGGVTMDSPDYPALLVCNALYGGSANSRLFLNVREKMSLCYYASSLIDKLKGLLVVSSGVEFGDFDRAQEAILAQLDELRAGRFTGEERNAAIRTVVNGLRGRLDSQGQMEDDCVTKLICGVRPDDGAELIRAVERVTAEDITQAAQRIRLDTVYRLTGKEGSAHG